MDASYESLVSDKRMDNVLPDKRWSVFRNEVSRFVLLLSDDGLMPKVEIDSSLKVPCLKIIDNRRTVNDVHTYFPFLRCELIVAG